MTFATYFTSIMLCISEWNIIINDKNLILFIRNWLNWGRAIYCILTEDICFFKFRMTQQWIMHYKTSKLILRMILCFWSLLVELISPSRCYSIQVLMCFLFVVCFSCVDDDALCPNWQIKVHLSWFRCLQSKQMLTLLCSPVRCVYLVTTLTRSDDWTWVQTSAKNRKVTCRFIWFLIFFFYVSTSHEVHVYLLAFDLYLFLLVFETLYNVV